MPPIWNTIESFFKKISRKPGGAAAPMPIVALIQDQHDRSLLTAIGKRDHLDVHFADTCGEAWYAANRLQSPVVLCARDVPGIEWPDAVRILALAVPRPCVILTSPVADDYLWKEIVARGGYDVLATPLRDADASRSIKLALSYWKNTSRGHVGLPAFRK
jgi:AmiR/NasT family two-component response regulator